MISVGTEFKETVDGYFNSWLPAYDIVKDAIETRKENDPEGRLIMFETSGCPWKEHLFNIEEKLGIKGEILYVIYKNKETDWRIQVKHNSNQAVPDGGTQITVRLIFNLVCTCKSNKFHKPKEFTRIMERNPR